MITINFQSRTPVYQQVYDDIVRLASLGVLKPNDKLPPVRTLAVDLGVNPNTISKAYKMLESDGVIYSTVGRGSFISDKFSETEAIKKQEVKKFKEATEQAYKKGLTREDMIEVVDSVAGRGNK